MIDLEDLPGGSSGYAMFDTLPEGPGPGPGGGGQPRYPGAHDSPAGGGQPGGGRFGAAGTDAFSWQDAVGLGSTVLNGVLGVIQTAGAAEAAKGNQQPSPQLQALQQQLAQYQSASQPGSGASVQQLQQQIADLQRQADIVQRQAPAAPSWQPYAIAGGVVTGLLALAGLVALAVRPTRA